MTESHTSLNCLNFVWSLTVSWQWQSHTSLNCLNFVWSLTVPWQWQSHTPVWTVWTVFGCWLCRDNDRVTHRSELPELCLVVDCVVTISVTHRSELPELSLVVDCVVTMTVTHRSELPELSFVVDRVVSKTESQLFIKRSSGVCIECVFRSEVILCGWQDIKTQELINQLSRLGDSWQLMPNQPWRS